MFKSKLNFFVLIFALSISFSASAQKFLPAFGGFSHKKTSYIHMEKGKTIKGTIKDLDWKKGLIEEVKLLDMNDKKIKIKPEDISHMYLPPNGWSKMSKTFSFLNDATQWDNTDLDQDIISKGLTYLEKSDVRIKKKTRTLMLQLANPSFSSQYLVYHDPITGETASAGIGGVKLAGGVPKSYFVKRKGEKVATELKKKDYDEVFKSMFGDCKEVMKKYGDNPRWLEFETHIYEYTQCKK